MLIIDGDYPMAYGGVVMQRDLTLPIDQVRARPPQESPQSISADDGTMASLPEMRNGEVAVALVKIGDCCIRRPGHEHGAHTTDQHSHASGRGHLAYYQILEAMGEVRLLKTPAEFRDHISSWENATDYQDLPVGMVVGMEGADPITWPGQVHEWFEGGLRVISLSHYGVSRYSHGTGTGTDGGLMEGAEELLHEMDSLGMILDVSHTSDESVRQELDIFEGPVLASHQNCRAVCPGERQFPDHQIKRIIERGAVIGHSMDAHMIWPPGVDWQNLPEKPPFTKEDVTLENFVDHIDHVSQLAGNSLHSAIGGDTDGQGGAINAPLEIDTVVDYQKVADVMATRGYTTEDIENVMWRNWKRFFEESLPG
ncbi:MAG: membrane dipeptidase [Chloroflexi bacterium]|nr:membrane dipeptidase [Chloroflexota bacterium]